VLSRRAAGPTSPDASLGRLWRAAARRDPEWLTVKRSIRAAVVMPGVFALSYEVVANSQTSLFAAFGAFGACCSSWTSRGGRGPAWSRTLHCSSSVCLHHRRHFVLHPHRARRRRHGSSRLCGAVLRNLQPQAATGTVLRCLPFVLPVAVAAPPSQIPARLLGWSLPGSSPSRLHAAACGHDPWHNDLSPDACRRRQRTEPTRRRPRRGAPGPRHRVGGRFGADALRQQFEATPYPPTGATPGASALAKLVGRMEWVGTNAMTADPEAPTLSLARVQTINAAVARTLAASASLICDRQGHPVEDAAIVNAWRQSERSSRI